jgi:hypothetical protein
MPWIVFLAMRCFLILILSLYTQNLSAQLRLEKIIHDTWQGVTGALLFFNKDSTYYVANQGCEEGYMAKGEWHVSGDTLLLSEGVDTGWTPHYTVSYSNKRENDSMVNILFTDVWGMSTYLPAAFYKDKEYKSTFFESSNGASVPLREVDAFYLAMLPNSTPQMIAVKDVDMTITVDVPIQMVDRTTTAYRKPKAAYIIGKDGLYHIAHKGQLLFKYEE